MKNIHVQETDPQVLLDGTRVPKKKGAKLILRGKGAHFNKLLAQLEDLQDEGLVVVEKKKR